MGMDGAVEKRGLRPKPETADNRKDDCVISAATGLSHGVGLQQAFTMSSCPYPGGRLRCRSCSSLDVTTTLVTVSSTREYVPDMSPAVDDLGQALSVLGISISGRTRYY